MPYFDGTGPQGAGPMTGRGLGPCGNGAGFRGRAFGGGYGFGRRFGANGFGGYRAYGQYQAPMTVRNEEQALIDESKDLEEELKAIKNRLAELKAKK